MNNIDNKTLTFTNPTVASQNLKVHDYVYVSRWSDCDPNDAWAVGFVTIVNDDYIKIKDAEGNPISNVADRRWKYGIKIPGMLGPLLLEELPKLRNGPFNPSDIYKLFQSFNIVNNSNEPDNNVKTNPNKDNIMLRQQLIIQNILNNISLAIRNNEKIKFSIGKIIINNDKITINDLKYDSAEQNTDGELISKVMELLNNKSDTIIDNDTPIISDDHLDDIYVIVNKINSFWSGDTAFVNDVKYAIMRPKDFMAKALNAIIGMAPNFYRLVKVGSDEYEDLFEYSIVHVDGRVCGFDKTFIYDLNYPGRYKKSDLPPILNSLDKEGYTSDQSSILYKVNGYKVLLIDSPEYFDSIKFKQ